jgi:hypothetical protein
MGEMKIVVAGCVAQQEGQALLRRVPEVDIVMGPQFANKLDELLERVEAAGSQVVWARCVAGRRTKSGSGNLLRPGTRLAGGPLSLRSVSVGGARRGSCAHRAL